MSRKGSSGLNSGYHDFDSYEEAEKFFGYGDGGMADQWEEGLTTGEKNAIGRYASGTYHAEFNYLLRKYDGDDSKLPKTKQKVAANLESAIDKYELLEPIVVYRAMSAQMFGYGIFDALGDGYSPAQMVKEINARKGEIFVDKGFASTTAKKGSTSWQDISWHNCVCRIKTPAGKGIGAYIGGFVGTKYHRQDVTEFLFNRNSAFQLDGAYESGGKVHINLTYVGKDE